MKKYCYYSESHVQKYKVHGSGERPARYEIKDNVLRDVSMIVSL